MEKEKSAVERLAERELERQDRAARAKKAYEKEERQRRANEDWNTYGVGDD